MKGSFSILLICCAWTACGQGLSVVSGSVVHNVSGLPLVGTVVKQNKDENHTISDADGQFRLTLNGLTDTLIFSHVGFRTLFVPLAQFENSSKVKLEEYSLELKAVTILSRSLNLKEVESGMRLIKDNLFAHESEVTNELYNLFLSALEESEAMEVLKRCDYDLSGYNQEKRDFFRRYGQPAKGKQKSKDSTEHDFSKFPAVNIPHEGAVLFCEWLTQQYNSNPGKKKFKNVKFRLPTLVEWQIAALGYPKFQSWKLDENFVEVVIPGDTISGMVKGTKTKIPVGNNNVYYPWFNAYNYRKKPFNHMGCYLGNFKVDGSKLVCNNIVRPGGDGWTMMSSTAAYFPNDMGLYDVVGNVAEMIDENFKACGGSWNDEPEKSTVRSVKPYRRPGDSVGFRVFMEVVEK